MAMPAAKQKKRPERGPMPLAGPSGGQFFFCAAAQRFFLIIKKVTLAIVEVPGCKGAHKGDRTNH